MLLPGKKTFGRSSHTFQGCQSDSFELALNVDTASQQIKNVKEEHLVSFLELILFTR